jgi:HSP20 family molecular chaperone IbpA
MNNEQEAPVNVMEDGGEVVITIPLPGAIAERTRVEIERDAVTVHATVSRQREGGVVHRAQWQAADWVAETDLPASIDPATADLRLVQGILTITAQVGDVPADSRIVVQPSAE